MLSYTLKCHYAAIVADRIFDALKCRAFNIDDNDTLRFESYLLIDISIQCNTDDRNTPYKIIYSTMDSIVGVWIIVVPIAFSFLLKHITPSVKIILIIIQCGSGAL